MFEEDNHMLDEIDSMRKEIGAWNIWFTDSKQNISQEQYKEIQELIISANKIIANGNKFNSTLKTKIFI